ncbi:MAG: hypothetical protein AAF420_10735 [Pseudomonadota bacterium]
MNDEDDFLAIANRVAEHADAIDIPNGRYLRWSSDCGAEIWIQLDDANGLIGMTPHFAGESQVRVGITSRITSSDDTTLDGAFHGWADPSGDDPESGTYPFVFDSPDYQLHSNLRIPSIHPVQVAAFAHEISIFDSVDDYNASQSGEPKFASQSFITSGMFSPDGGSTEPPQAYGIFTGHIVQTAKKRNGLTGSSFHWALVDSLGGLFDVVIDPELVQSEPKASGVLSGSFWLSGRIAAK